MKKLEIKQIKLKKKKEKESLRKHEPWSSGTVHDFKEFRRIRNFGTIIITIDPTVFEADS